MLRPTFVCSFFLALALPALFAAEPTGPSTSSSSTVDYAREVLPILANNCFVCHGPAERKAGLRLDRREDAVKPARSGQPALRPGNWNDSELMRRILAADESERMPPVKSKKTLSAHDKETLKKWIAQGAEYKVHWAFTKPARHPLPAVKAHAWKNNEIDAFILSRIEQAGLKPSPEADRPTLIRRLSLDLRGMPPSLAEVEQFLADRSPDAYEKLVDRILASPHYGEKMALLWLDLARFGDTSGFENDSVRQMWIWRDWVIAAFNRNMPFDQFTTEQLAGDLLPGPTQDQKVASGFNRNTRFNEEGGADPEEFTIRYNVDRTNTLGQVWLGMTLGCAECHDHKYDPISQKEYYQLFAYFTGIKEPFASGNHNVPLPPILKMPSPAQAESLAKFQKQQARLQGEIDAVLAKIAYKDPFEKNDNLGKRTAKPQDIVWLDDDLPAGAKAELKDHWKWVDAPHPVQSGKVSLAGKGAGLQRLDFTGATKPLFLSPGDKLFAYVFLDPKNAPKSIMLQFDDGTWEHRAFWGEDKCLLAGMPIGPAHFNAGALPAAGKWARLELDADKLNLLPDARIRGASFVHFGGTVYFDKLGIQTSFDPDDSCQKSVTVWEHRAKANTKLPAEVTAALKIEPAKRKPEEKSKILHLFLRRVYQETYSTFAPLEKEFDAVSAKVKQTDDAIPYTMISEEMPEPRPAHVLLRGDFLKKGEKVDRAVPSIFPPLPIKQPNNRLTLARWLLSPDHPLTSRVAVNRLWAQMFGTPLVKSIGDFGTQGEYPSHPELLDWLALEFMRPAEEHAPRWDVKRLLKKIAMSSTYRQSSVVVPGAAAKVDPNNRLLSRAPRFRLSAEEIRDGALSISGLLNPKIGGPSVMPYQPTDFYKGKNEGWTWTVSQGGDQYRRGMYTFWRRTTLHPMFAIFDAPSREECSVARARTNTPLQALVTLNDPTFIEAARVFAQNVLTSPATDLDARLRLAFRTALARDPSPAEISVLKIHYDQSRRRYEMNKDAATKLVATGQHPRPTQIDITDHATWTTLCNMLLNLDEAITRE